ncbi:MAG: hypothetical protein V7760_03730 [Marinobacter sp.]
MSRWLALLLSCFLLWGFVSVTLGQDSPETQDTRRVDALEQALNDEAAANDQVKPMSPPLSVSRQYLDEEGLQAMQEAFKSYYQYRSQGFRHRQLVFEWQLLSSRIIFVVVIVLVGSGIYFSWLQFRADMKKAGKGDNGQAMSTLEASATGIKVSSPVLGVIILVISLLFFYLYLQYVYPIEEIL